MTNNPADKNPADSKNDPVDIWHAMIGEMEKGFNAFANQAMASPEFSKVVDQVGGVSAGAQKQLGEMMEKYLAGMNLPSRSQMVNFGERLNAIEGQLADMSALLRQSLTQTQNKPGVPDSGFPAAPKPPRTRRPPRSVEIKTSDGK